MGAERHGAIRLKNFYKIFFIFARSAITASSAVSKFVERTKLVPVYEVSFYTRMYNLRLHLIRIWWMGMFTRLIQYIFAFIKNKFNISFITASLFTTFSVKISITECFAFAIYVMLILQLSSSFN